MRTAITTFLCGMLLCLACGTSTSASASELTLINSGICTGVVDHIAIGIGEVFKKGVEELFCFTRVVGPHHEDKEQFVQHVWYYQNTERARVVLPVNSSNWGTYSSKIIQSFEIGDWRVEVLDPNGETIEVFRFFIKE